MDFSAMRSALLARVERSLDVERQMPWTVLAVFSAPHSRTTLRQIPTLATSGSLSATTRAASSHIVLSTGVMGTFSALLCYCIVPVSIYTKPFFYCATFV